MISVLIDVSIRCLRRREERERDAIRVLDIKKGFTEEVPFGQKAVQLDVIWCSLIVMFNQGSFCLVEVHS